MNDGVTEIKKLTKRDFESDQEPRWCPGCGDYSILTQMKKLLPDLGISKENIVFVSGIGCSSRFPYYLNTYGFHGIHGRAPVIATGIKIANPNLKVFVITGDGDGLSIGGNHFIHLCRRNVDITIILFNNRIYGLTKGQYSPTSEKGKVTKSSPYGSVENPFNPVKIALAAGATFVARSIDKDQKHLIEILRRAAEHKGTSFVEVYQNCNIFNDGTFSQLTDPDKKDENLLVMEHGNPYLFGSENDKCLHWDNSGFKILKNKGRHSTNEDMLHDEYNQNTLMPFALSDLDQLEGYPTPIGIFREIQADTYEELLNNQINLVKQEKGEGTLKGLLESGNTWEVK
jgi:2-oxoglutarate ferredoxin oxidoreductase subunit beta